MKIPLTVCSLRQLSSASVSARVRRLSPMLDDIMARTRSRPPKASVAHAASAAGNALRKPTGSVIGSISIGVRGTGVGITVGGTGVAVSSGLLLHAITTDIRAAIASNSTVFWRNISELSIPIRV